MSEHEDSTGRRSGRPLLSMALLAGIAAVAVTIAYPAAARRGKAENGGHSGVAVVSTPHLVGDTPRLVFSTRTVVSAGGSRPGRGRTQALAPADETPKFEGYITYPR